MEQTKINYPSFIELPIYILSTPDKEVNEFILTKLKLNPLQVIFYYPGVLSFKGKDVQVTTMCIGSSRFYIDMSFDELDEYWEEIKKSIDIIEPLY